MISLTQQEGSAILQAAEELVRRKLSNDINTAIIQRYYKIKEQLFTPHGEETSEELVAGYATAIEIDFPLFPMSALATIGDYQVDFLIGSMVKLFDIYS